MMHSTTTPTKAERARFEELHEIGCICCRKRGLRTWPIEIHHLLYGYRRLGHMYTLPLCGWHHQGRPAQNWTIKSAIAVFGPSLAHGSKPFHAAFGSDGELLAEVDALIAQMRGVEAVA